MKIIVCPFQSKQCRRVGPNAWSRSSHRSSPTWTRWRRLIKAFIYLIFAQHDKILLGTPLMIHANHGCGDRLNLYLLIIWTHRCVFFSKQNCCVIEYSQCNNNRNEVWNSSASSHSVTTTTTSTTIFITNNIRSFLNTRSYHIFFYKSPRTYREKFTWTTFFLLHSAYLLNLFVIHLSQILKLHTFRLLFLDFFFC